VEQQFVEWAACKNKKDLMICVKLHKSYRNLLAVCDEELLGKKFIEGKKVLDVRESFYNGEIISVEEAIKLMKQQKIEDSTFSIVGKNSIKAAENARIINSEYAKEVQKIPFILSLL